MEEQNKECNHFWVVYESRAEGCRTGGVGTSTWRLSSLTTNKLVCGNCGEFKSIYER